MLRKNQRKNHQYHFDEIGDILKELFVKVHCCSATNSVRKTLDVCSITKEEFVNELTMLLDDVYNAKIVVVDNSKIQIDFGLHRKFVLSVA